MLPRLCVLDLSCNPLLAQEVDGGSFGQLASLLSHAVGLHTLRLQSCGLAADSLKHLGALPVVLDIFCPLLFKVCYFNRMFEGFGLLIVGSSPPCCPADGSLRSLSALRELDLSCNKSLAGGLNHLCLQLAHLSHLESLDLHLCSLTRVDLEALSEYQQGSNLHTRQSEAVM